MSLRTPYVQSAHAFVPNEAMRNQRYYSYEDAAQYGLLYYYPEHHIPLGGIKTAIGAVPRQDMPQADGWAKEWPWLQSHVWGANSLLYDYSPWGPAMRHNIVTGGNNDLAPCLRSLPSPAKTLVPTNVYPHHYTIFAIVKGEDAGGTWSRRFLTHRAGAGLKECLELGYKDNTHSITWSTGVPAYLLQTDYVSASVADWIRPDGWMRLAFSFTALSASAGTVSIWIEGKLFLEWFAAYDDIYATQGMVAGGNFEQKDGYSWKGSIAQLACVFTGKVRMGNDQILRWFDDPWWFLKAERSMFVPSERCPYGVLSIEPACDADLSIGPSSYGEIALEAAAEADLSVGPAVDGVLSIEPASDANLSICSRGIR